ncbi:ribosomal protein L36 [Neofusicoccum parvum]|nr:ribosomal protein L36 [Neofusicoccum parvum]
MLARTLLLPLRRPTLAALATTTTAAAAAPTTRAYSALQPWRSAAAAARPTTTTTTQLLWAQQVRGMKVRSSVKKLCDGCKVKKHAHPDGGADRLGWIGADGIGDNRA